MDSITAHRRTRRQFLTGVVRIGVGVAAAAALGSGTALPSFAQGRRPERVKVLVDDVREGTAVDFARGRARGVKVVATPEGAALLGSAGGAFVSGVMTLAFPATHLGLHWVLTASTPEVVQVAVRGSADRQRWSEWYPLAIEAIAERTTKREVFAALAPANRDRFVQYKVDFVSEVETAVESITVTSLNSVDGPVESLATATATAVTLTEANVSVNLVTREGWGCDESLGDSNGTERWPEMYVPAKKVVVHHTATSNSYSDGAAEVRAVYTYHAKTLGWGDIGYNVLIDHNGLIYEGRHGRGEDSSTRQIMSADVVAGHDLYYNYGTVGVSCLGDFSRRPYNQVDAIGRDYPQMLASLDQVTAFECARDYIDPAGASDFLRSDDTWSSAAWAEPMANISGHSDTNATKCPGAGLYNYLPTLRANVAAKLAGNTAVPTLGGGQAGDTLSFTWNSTAYTGYLYALEGWRRVPNSEDIEYLTLNDGFYMIDSGYNDSLAKEMAWKAAASTSFSYSLKTPGHYTMHVRGDGGVYEANVTLLVTDVGGTTNNPPTASFTATPSGLTCAFDASASNDDGTITSYAWNFGDGSSGSGVTANHTYAAAGTYAVTLTVTDDGGATGTSSENVTVSTTSSGGTVHIGDLDGSTKAVNRNFWNATVEVTVHDANHAVVAGATVTGSWGGDYSGTASGITDANGQCAFTTANIRGTTGSVTFAVGNIAASGLPYDADDNHDPESDSNGSSITLTK